MSTPVTTERRVPRARMSKRKRSRLIRIGVYTLTVLLVVFLIVKVDWTKLQQTFFDPAIFRAQFPAVITQAARNTLIFTFFAFTGGLALGLLLALMKLSSIGFYRTVATVYIEIFRGLPALVTLIIVGFVLPIALQVKIPGTYGPGSVGLAVVAAAYMAETLRAGIEAVPKGQMEAARSLGMGHGRALFSIIIPQAFRIILPPLTNEFVLLIKDTSLIFVLGTTEATIELTKFGRDAVSQTFNGTPIIVVALVYLLITIPLTQLVAALERRGKRGTR